MEPEADKLIMENIAKNLSDQDEYPSTMRVQERCISIIGNLWHAQEAIGTATVGSSEAIMLGGLALKKAWQNKRKAEGKDASKPNIIFGNNAQVALEKFARYFDVEERLIPVSAESHHVLDVEKAVEACDENTIGIFVILGSTYTGHFEDVKRLSELLDEHEKKTGHSINIHVDAARYKKKVFQVNINAFSLCFVPEQWRFHRPFCFPGSRVGFPPAPRGFDQLVWPQVWPELRRHWLGAVAFNRASSQGARV